MKFSEIFRGAQYFIRVNPRDLSKPKFSCDAIWDFVDDRLQSWSATCELTERVGEFQHDLGLIGGYNDFKEFETRQRTATKASQQARLLWLEWCALMAEEEGL